MLRKRLLSNFYRSGENWIQSDVAFRACGENVAIFFNCGVIERHPGTLGTGILVSAQILPLRDTDIGIFFVIFFTLGGGSRQASIGKCPLYMAVYGLRYEIVLHVDSPSIVY